MQMRQMSTVLITFQTAYKNKASFLLEEQRPVSECPQQPQNCFIETGPLTSRWSLQGPVPTWHCPCSNHCNPISHFGSAAYCLAKAWVFVLKTFHDTGSFEACLCRPLCPSPTKFISHCCLCAGIYDVTANISFVLRWRISQGSCPYGVKQTANMDRLWLGSWGWVDIMVAAPGPIWRGMDSQFLQFSHS